MSTAAPRGSVTGMRRSTETTGARDVGLDRAVIVQSLICIVPAMAAVGIGAPQAGAYYFFAAYLGFLGWSLLCGYSVRALALTVGVLPGLSLFRDLFLYNSVILVYSVVVFGLLLRSRHHMREMWRAGFAGVLYICVLYWGVSYVITGDYSANLRLLELTLSAAALVLLISHPIQLASALFSLTLGLVAWGLAFLPYGHRLGLATIGGVQLGNPITFGLPLAFMFTLLVADQGKLLLLQRNAWIRLLLTLVVGAFLLLSTSRGSWLVAASSVAMVLLFKRYDRRIAIVGIVLMLGVGLLLLQTSRGADFAAGLQRTFSEERSLRNRTSGRSDQWMLLPVALHDHPVLGFGPGRGPSVYAKYSLLDPDVHFRRGVEMRWHSLYLQVAIETGALGVLVLTTLFFLLFRSNIRAWRYTGDVAPMLGAIGFALLALTVSGMDAASGLFLGLGLSAVGRAESAQQAPEPLPVPSRPTIRDWSAGQAPHWESDT